MIDNVPKCIFYVQPSLIPNTTRSVCWQSRLSSYSFGGVLACFDSLCKIPQIEINHHTANVHATIPPLVLRLSHLGYLVPDLLDGEDARCADTQLLPRAVRDGVMVFEDLDKRRRVIEYAEVVQDLRDAIVREHGQLADARGEERVGI